MFKMFIINHVWERGVRRGSVGLVWNGGKKSQKPSE
jgi:hypothetical protein